MSTLEIKNLHAKIEGKEILKGVNLTINSGEVHAIMGPNGTGKSTLSAVIMGNTKYEVTSGEVLLDGVNMLDLAVDERARAGLFLAMQYPSEIAGITNSDFIRQAMKSSNVETGSLFKYIKKLEGSIADLKMKPDMANRYLNEGFSGGEKKRNEILQMKMLNPKFAILDEIDSGLDIDALTVVGENLTQMMDERNDDLGLLMITHYQRLLNHIKPTHVHIMMGGRIVQSGGIEIAEQLEETGYEALRVQYGIDKEEAEEQKRIKINQCATHVAVNGNEK